jgi:hypothetical protein
MPMSRNTWLPVSETEWYVSESIDGLPVSRKPTNFVTAMAALATSAAMTTDLLSAMDATTRAPDLFLAWVGDAGNPPT